MSRLSYPVRARARWTGAGRGAGLDDPRTTTRARDAARITSGRPGPPVAPRPAGCPILTREPGKAALGILEVPAANYRRCNALPRRRAARPRRGPARTLRGRPLPLARGPRRPAHAGLDGGPGRGDRRGARRAADARRLRRTARATGARRGRRGPPLARGRGLLDPARPGPGARGAPRPRGRRCPAGADRPGGPGPRGDDDARRLVRLVG